jgi:hypothetical protein
MRTLLIALALSISTTAQAQPIHGAAQTPPVTQIPASPPRQAPSRPHAPPPQSVPPPTVFPLPPLTTPPAGGLTHGFPGFFANDTSVPRRMTPSGRHSPIVTPFIGGFVGGYPVGEDPADRARAATPPAEPPGVLRLAVTPDTAQVYVDGFFVASVEDLDAQRDLALEAGSHRIEIRAPDYQTLTFDVRIAPREVITYRNALEIARPAAIPPRAARAPAGPMYVIPNCYLGNVPPRASRLPSGCDIAKVQVLGKR